MKVLLPLILLLTLSLGTIQAQTPEIRDGILIRMLGADYNGVNGGTFLQGKYLGGGVEVGYWHKFADIFNLGIPLKYTKARFQDSLSDRNVFSADILGQIDFIPHKKFAPMLHSGLGLVKEDNVDLDFNVPVGLALRYNLGIAAQLVGNVEYRYVLGDQAHDNFQFGVGLMVMLGKNPAILAENEQLAALKKDSDKDGVRDVADDCPDVPGVKAFNGCPDTDEDGVPDSEDQCIDVAGLAELMGCPDMDGDGVPDHKDACPDKAGDQADGCPTPAPVVVLDADGDGFNDDADNCPTVAGSLNGCPDVDSDGVPDKDDRCPTLAGPVALRGCPDKDIDGVPDIDDKCPNQAGYQDNYGCPTVNIEVQQKLDYAMRSVRFKTGSDEFSPGTTDILDDVFSVLSEFPDYSMSIEGHTDNQGKEESNYRLSERRAKACYNFLIKSGISSTRLTYRGLGETQPIADNNTPEGRAINRRVEFRLIQPHR